MTASRLTRRLTKGIAASGMNMREVAEAADVKYGWLRQVKIGGVQKPDPEALARVAGVLGIPADELLALTDQLGAAESVHRVTSNSADIAAAIRAQTSVFEQLITTSQESNRLLAARLDAAEKRADDMETLIRALLSPEPSSAAVEAWMLASGRASLDRIRSRARRRDPVPTGEG